MLRSMINCADDGVDYSVEPPLDDVVATPVSCVNGDPLCPCNSLDDDDDDEELEDWDDEDDYDDDEDDDYEDEDSDLDDEDSWLEDEDDDDYDEDLWDED